MQYQITQVIREITDRTNAPDWANQDNLLAKVEAIRLKARKDILALGFSENEAAVDVSLFGINEMGIFHLAQELGWNATQSWYEPPVKTEGGEITIYYEPEEVVW